jgi:ABC-2 type transport system ATP-binding protein
LINKGRTALHGEGDQLKRNFAGHAVTITGQGDFLNVPGVLEARQVNGDWRLSLAQGTGPPDVFKALAARDGIKIERFEIAEPSLDDIFIWTVQGEQEPNHA